MTRDEIFDTLAAAGVVKVEIEFSGGGDEGNVDETTFIVKEGDALLGYELHGVPLLMARHDDPEGEFNIDEFGESLEEFAVERICFDGPGIIGKIELDVVNRSGTLDCSIEEYVDQETETF